MKKILSIIIPTRNRSLSLRSVIDILKNYNLDIIIVDDNSDFFHRIKNKKLDQEINCKYFFLKKNYGQSYALNYGLKFCSTKYVWFFDDDDFITPVSLTKIMQYVKNCNFNGVLFSMRIIFKNKTMKKCYPKLSEHNFSALREKRQKVNTSCAVFNTQNVRFLGGWDKNLYSGTDSDFFLRFVKRYNFKIYRNAEIEVNFSIPDRVTNNLKKQLIGKLQFIYKHYYTISFKRILTYVITILTFYPFFNDIKQKIFLYLNQNKYVSK